ncbi:MULTISPECIES: 2-phosphosulfolactate phosphatase [unclassified Bradyrhizobium]|uniref:2-phosphosulfolactate phosphatase n=2 Tax=unclassified Bradyrhizobium TaxID=2631580 RepID=UPI0028ED15D5|nr:MULTISPECIES: 2-phosphosulfolactate phosphatase [unclassified Bradyrhizobium]
MGGETMDIRLDSLITGAERAQGAVVIIDVFRAFTTAAVALARGATKIIMVDTVEEALRLRAAGVGQICMGEVGGHKPNGFDLGNSPFDASQALLDGITVIQRTSAGTRGIVAAKQATQLYAGSLVTAKATAQAVTRHAPARVSLVAMGMNGEIRTDEDELCAIHLRNLLQGRPGCIAGTRNVILAGPQIPDFRDPAKPHLHPEDLDIAIDIDRYDFAVRISKEDGRLVARRDLSHLAA